jgi:hypothetical protein
VVHSPGGYLWLLVRASWDTRVHVALPYGVGDRRAAALGSRPMLAGPAVMCVGRAAQKFGARAVFGPVGLDYRLDTSSIWHSKSGDRETRAKTRLKRCKHRNCLLATFHCTLSVYSESSLVRDLAANNLLLSRRVLGNRRDASGPWSYWSPKGWSCPMAGVPPCTHMLFSWRVFPHTYCLRYASTA